MWWKIFWTLTLLSAIIFSVRWVQQSQKISAPHKMLYYRMEVPGEPSITPTGKSIGEEIKDWITYIIMTGNATVGLVASVISLKNKIKKKKRKK